MRGREVCLWMCDTMREALQDPRRSWLRPRPRADMGLWEGPLTERNRMYHNYIKHS